MKTPQSTHESNSKFVMCVFYLGPLPSGVKSPGYLESISGDRRPAAYIVQASVDEEQGRQRTIDQVEPWISGEFAIKWAREHVRLISLKSNLGLSSKEIMNDYYVRVPYPISSSSSGELVRKAGLSASQSAVPDGDSADDIYKRKMLDKNVSLEERAAIAKTRYVRGGGVPFTPSQETFPRDGDHWIGSD